MRTELDQPAVVHAQDAAPPSPEALLRSDEAFDSLFPAHVRAASLRHFTPIEIARRAAGLLVTRPGTRVLDVGSGAGKFCLVGALTTTGVFTGVERRPALVEVARRAAATLGVNVRFLAAEMSSLDWGEFEAFYFYNPFAENFGGAIDDQVPTDRARFYQYLEEAKLRLRQAASGTRVVTFHGLGSCLPGGYRLLRREPAGFDSLDLWVKAPRPYTATAGDDPCLPEAA